MSVVGIQMKADMAVELKRRHGLSCAQAVVCALADQTELTEEVLKEISAGFCGGMGTQDATCGALI